MKACNSKYLTSILVILYDIVPLSITSLLSIHVLTAKSAESFHGINA